MRQALRTYGVQLALVGVAAVWGGTFVTVKDAVARYPMYAFLTLRFAIAVLAFVAVMPSSIRFMRRDTLGVGVLAGMFLTAGYVFQTWGLQDTSASKAAFITGMFVVITPVLQALVLRRIPHRTTVIGVLLAVAGLWFLSGGGADSWNIGDTRVLICAFAYAGHFIVLGGLGRDHDVAPLTLVQLATVGVASAAVSLATEPLGLPGDAGVWFALVLTGVFASAVAFAVQTYAQRFLSPTKTALILIMEPVFGGVFGYFAGERLGLSGVAGSALIFAGMLVAEVIGSLRGPDEPPAELEPTLEGPPILVEGGE
ncbi:MAG: DMT family transporter [Coriobacteriia bacterium]|nr:DMT family transporter [Coriobacteriia bacterium]MBN2840315.1 DMT family transporter [Coriobacteriia bacterium]